MNLAGARARVLVYLRRPRICFLLLSLWTRILLLTKSIVRILACLRISNCKMSEANSIAGTVGAWVGGMIQLSTQLFLTYMSYREKGWSPLPRNPDDEAKKELLQDILNVLREIKDSTAANTALLGNINTIAEEMRDGAGLPCSSTQTHNAAHSQQL